MRILGFTKKWLKLHLELPVADRPDFTTFRWRRKDADKGRDWHNSEVLKIVYRPRHEHEILGIAQVIKKEPKQCQMVTEEEAIADGFDDVPEMMDFLNPPAPAGMQIINKLTLRWVVPPLGQEKK